MSRMMRTVCHVLTCSVLAVGPVLAEDIDASLAGLTVPGKRVSAKKQILDAMDRIETQLMVIIQERAAYLDADRNTLVNAIEILGRIRSRKAVPALLDMIDFEAVVGLSDQEQTRSVPLGHLYPAVGSLVEIGDWKSIVAALHSVESAQKRDLMLILLKKILGVKLSEQALIEAIDQSSDPVSKERLSVATRRLRSVQEP